MLSKPQFDAHNQHQRDYFEMRVSPRMLPGNTPYILNHIDHLAAFGKLQKSDLLLDVGCGMGRYTIPMLEQGYRVDGLDLSPVLLERLQGYNAGRFQTDLYGIDLLARPPELKAKYDAIIGFFTLHHVHNLAECYAAMRHYVRPGGQIIFLEPNAYCPLYYVQITLTPGMTWAGDGGMVNMRRRPLAEACRAAGLVDFRLSLFGWLPPFLRNKRFGQGLENALQRVPGVQGSRAFMLVGATVPAEG
jgi:SAM-dependent methyltransferase